MTAKDSADKVLGEIDAAGATAAWNIANVVLDGCGLTHTGENLQRFGNLGDEAWHLYASNFGPVSNGRPANTKVATTHCCPLPKENADQVKEGDLQTDPRTIKRAAVSKLMVSDLQPQAFPERSSSACPNLTTCSSAAAAATRTSAIEVTSTNPMMSSRRTNPTFAYLTSLIHITFILDHLQSNNKFELNLHKNLFRKFY